MDYLFKLVIVGDSGVGKTNLLSKYLNNSFQDNSKATIGVELSTKVLHIDGKTIQNQIWDTAGQERFRAIASSYYRNTVGAVIVFDLTRAKTFENLPNWLKEIQQYADPSICVTLIGNKSDLTVSREVKPEVIEDFLMQHRLNYLETSALNGSNVARAFESLIKCNLYLNLEIYQQQKNKPKKVEDGSTAGANNLTKLKSDKTKINKTDKKIIKSSCC